MKKIALLLLLNIYALTISGIGIKQFYCCGKLKSTSISFVQDKNKCDKGNEKSGCCNTKYQVLKVKDSHVAAEDVSRPLYYFTDLHLLTSSFEINALANQPGSLANASHAPPLHHGISIYILNCNYRI